MSERYFRLLTGGPAPRCSDVRPEAGRRRKVRQELSWETAGLLGVLLAGCAAQPLERAEIEYRRENARIEATERFGELRRTCTANGGVMHIPRTTSGRLPPSATELRLATCSSRFWPVRRR